MKPRAGMVLRVDPRTTVIFAAMFSPALLVAGLLLWRGRQPGDAAILCAVYATGLYWMAGRTVELVPGHLVYRVFFVRKTIDVSDVVAASVVSRPAPTLELLYAGSSKPVPAFIVKPFTKAGVAAMLQHIVAASPEARLHRIADSLREGSFDAVARDARRAMNLLRLALSVAGMLTAVAVARVFSR